jgi:ABC-2 type transport system ATP-binding protein
VVLSKPVANLGQYGEVIDQQGGVRFRVPKAETSSATARILAELPVDDLTVEDPAVEDVIEKAFSREGL